jgi:hypothetical protein
MPVESADRENTLLGDGQWDELEMELTPSAPQDAKVNFRRANLLALRGEYEKALPLYDACIGQRWPGTVALNNKGVALTRLGQARAAWPCFVEAATPADNGTPCAAALFNLAVIYEFLDEGPGELPPIVREVQEPDLPATPGEIAVHYLRAANAALAQAVRQKSMLDRPLFLWKDDVPSLFGFELDQSQEDIRQADEHFQTAIQGVAEGQWLQAIRHLAAARGLQPSLAPRTRDLERRARLGLCAELRREATLAWNAGQFASARESIEKLLVQLPELPDRGVILSILASEIDAFVGKLSDDAAESDIVALTATARTMAKMYDDLAADAPADTVDTTIVTRLKRACRGSWDRKVARLIEKDEHREAAALLGFSAWEWLAGPEELAERRRHVFSAEAAALQRSAAAARAAGDDARARSLLAEARRAASASGDPTLEDACLAMLGDLYPPPAPLDWSAIEANLRDGHYKDVLREATEQLQLTPADATLRALRDVAIARLLEQLTQVVALEEWKEAIEDARYILEYEPASKRARRLEAQACRGRIDELRAFLQNALRQHKLDIAEELLQAAILLDENDARVVEMRRTMSTARGSSGEGDDQFEEARAQFEAARRHGDASLAVEAVLRMQARRALATETGDAAEWAAGAAVAYARSLFDRDPSPDVASQLLPLIEKVLVLSPERPAALELRAQLIAAQRGTAATRLSKSRELLQLAEQALNDLRPIDALDLVQQLDLLDEPSHRDDVKDCRTWAIEQIQKRLRTELRTREGREAAAPLIAALQGLGEAVPEVEMEPDATDPAAEAPARAEKGATSRLRSLWKRLGLFRRIVPVIVLLLAGATPLRGQPIAAAGYEDHYWLMLVDASMSFAAIDREVTARIGTSSYRLRNELLTLSQILLGVVTETDPRRRNFVKVVFFGSSVRPKASTWEPIRWPNVQAEASWHFPTDINDRTDVVAAIQHGAEELEKVTGSVRRHLLLISDGEMDVGETNRRRGTTFREEEVAAYRRVFAEDGPILRLGRSQVAVHTIAIDALARDDENSRQQEIRAVLSRMGAATVGGQFLALLEHLAKEAGSGPQPFSEGPYFLEAFAQATAGNARLLLPTRPLEVVWQTFFPEATFRRTITPGSSFLVALARADEPVRLCFNGAASPNVTLRYDRATGTRTTEPTGAPIRAQYQATSQYVTWLIAEPTATCIEPSTAYHGNDVELQWQPPPSNKAGGEAVELYADLTKRSSSEPPLKWWRDQVTERLDLDQVRATLVHTPPSGARVEMTITGDVLSTKDGILRLHARINDLAPGTHTVVARVAVGERERDWEEVSPVLSFVIGPPPPRRWWPRVVLAMVLFAGGYGLYRGSRPAPPTMLPLVVYAAHDSQVHSTGRPRRLCVSLSRDAIEAVFDAPKRDNGTGPAVILEAVKGHIYRLSARNGSGWQFRLLPCPPIVEPDFGPVPGTGVEIQMLAFIEGEALELKYEQHVAEVRMTGFPGRIRNEGAFHG